jgi:hypothetical protein
VGEPDGEATGDVEGETAGDTGGTAGGFGSEAHAPRDKAKNTSIIDFFIVLIPQTVMTCRSKSKIKDRDGSPVLSQRLHSLMPVNAFL